MTVPYYPAAYNAGAGNVIKAKGIPQNDETPHYVSEVLKFARVYAQLMAQSRKR